MGETWRMMRSRTLVRAAACLLAGVVAGCTNAGEGRDSLPRTCFTPSLQFSRQVPDALRDAVAARVSTLLQFGNREGNAISIQIDIGGERGWPPSAVADMPAWAYWPRYIQANGQACAVTAYFRRRGELTSVDVAFTYEKPEIDQTLIAYCIQSALFCR